MTHDSPVQPKTPTTPAGGFAKLAELLVTRYREGTVDAPQIIVVLGAAASAWSHMPLWRQQKEPILRLAKELYPKFINEAWCRLAPYIGHLPPEMQDNPVEAERELLKRATTDQICNAACAMEVVGEAVREYLCKEYSSVKGRPRDEIDAGPPPQLAYELIAHMLKHRFIDHVLTFNFDPLLDTAIRHELSPNDYEFILSDHHRLSVGSAEKSFIIKLHGTVDAPQTLRFAARDTELLTPRMIDLLDKMLLISGNGSKSHILSLGYGWEDQGFMSWVKSRHALIEGITVVRRGSDKDALERLAHSLSDISPSIITTDALKASNIGVLSVDHFVWALWNTIYEQLCESTAPKEQGEFVMPASRHILLGHWFGPNIGHKPRQIQLETPLDRRHPHTTENRFCAELLLHLIKCKGMVNLSVMARDRRLHDLRSRLKGQHVLDDSAFLERSAFPSVNETYFLRQPEKETTQQHGQSAAAPKDTLSDEDVMTTGDFVTWVTDQIGIWPALVPQFDGEKIVLRKVDGEEFLALHIGRIVDALEVEVVADGDASAQWLFVAGMPLITALDLKRKSRELLAQNWTHLLVIAETGEWLAKDELAPQLQNRSLLLLRSSLDSLDQWHLGRQKLSQTLLNLGRIKGITLSWGELRWWQHNRHLTLAYDDTRDRFTGGIYFRRRLKAHQISPIYVYDDWDCIELFNTFLGYMRRACEEAVERANDSLRKCRGNAGDVLARERLRGSLETICLGASAVQLATRIEVKWFGNGRRGGFAKEARSRVAERRKSVEAYLSEGCNIMKGLDRLSDGSSLLPGVLKTRLKEVERYIIRAESPGKGVRVRGSSPRKQRKRASQQDRGSTTQKIEK